MAAAITWEDSVASWGEGGWQQQPSPERTGLPPGGREGGSSSPHLRGQGCLLGTQLGHVLVQQLGLAGQAVQLGFGADLQGSVGGGLGRNSSVSERTCKGRGEDSVGAREEGQGGWIGAHTLTAVEQRTEERKAEL